MNYQGLSLIDKGQVTETLSDVVAAPEAIELAVSIVEYLKNPWRPVTSREPKGAIFTGTNQALAARCIAGQAGASLLSISASELYSSDSGRGTCANQLFASAVYRAPCVIFIDNIDAIARQPAVSSGRGTSESARTYDQILNALDGLSTNRGVFVIAATNRPRFLDSALKRPGRLTLTIAW